MPHEIDYEIYGRGNAICRIELDPQEAVVRKQVVYEMDSDIKDEEHYFWRWFQSGQQCFKGNLFSAGKTIADWGKPF